MPGVSGSEVVRALRALPGRAGLTPALAMIDHMDRVRAAVVKLNLAVRGLYGEGSKAHGDFFHRRAFRTEAFPFAQRLHVVRDGFAMGHQHDVGFEKVAHFREVGWKFERWIDVAYWECVLS